MVDDEIDKIEEEIEKDITQVDGLDEDEIKNELNAMGFIWKIVNDKLKADKICFGCKKSSDFTKEPLHVVVVNKGIETGVCAFVSLCSECHKKAQNDKQNEGDDKHE